MKIAAIAREEIHSPCMVGKDLAILECVIGELTAAGHHATLYKANRLETGTLQECSSCDAIVHMLRGTEKLAFLETAAKCGATIINSTAAVKNCSRDRFTAILSESGIQQPSYQVTPTKEAPPTAGYPMWIKKNRGWSMHKDDVCYAADHTDAIAIFEQFRQRGIDEVHCCSHIEGDIIKFYGIGTDFFRWYYPNPENTKFSLERHNGATSNNAFETSRLRAETSAAAKALGLDIYGGDAIITEDGEIYIIDINDFPSFSAFREEAARAIAHLVTSQKRE
jgi:glutathione synthase/RimK-type ligase-like ATP-grasp enzyme